MSQGKHWRKINRFTGTRTTKMASYFWREIFYVTLPGTPGKIPGNSESTELRKEFGTTLTISKLRHGQGSSTLIFIIES